MGPQEGETGLLLRNLRSQASCLSCSSGRGFETSEARQVRDPPISILHLFLPPSTPLPYPKITAPHIPAFSLQDMAVGLGWGRSQVRLPGQGWGCREVHQEGGWRDVAGRQRVWWAHNRCHVRWLDHFAPLALPEQGFSGLARGLPLKAVSALEVTEDWRLGQAEARRAAWDRCQLGLTALPPPPRPI